MSRTPTAVEQLTDRQVQVLELVAQGLSDAMIARILDVSLTTVHTHVIDVRHKLGAINRTHAVHLGHQAGILAREGM